MSEAPLQPSSPKANTSQSKAAIPKMNKELMSLAPTAVVTMFEINLTDILFAKNLSGPSTPESERIFRFHNSINILNNEIYWQGLAYSACPLTAEGFEVSSKGALPRPKLSLTVTDDHLKTFSFMKGQLRAIGDPAGVSVTRIRTLAKFLDDANFSDDTRPKGHEASPFSEFPRDIYFVSRVAMENKNQLEWELSSVLDLENLYLPKRRMWSNRCNWEYRGEGCCYEFRSSAPKISSSTGNITSFEKAHGDASLPGGAPPRANAMDEHFSTLLPNISLNGQGEFSMSTAYRKGDFVYVEKNAIRYYFVRMRHGGAGIDVTNTDYWTADQCSKTIKGCKLRWKTEICGHNKGGALPYGGFAGLNRLT